MLIVILLIVILWVVPRLTVGLYVSPCELILCIAMNNDMWIVYEFC